MALENQKQVDQLNNGFGKPEIDAYDSVLNVIQYLPFELDILVQKYLKSEIFSDILSKNVQYSNGSSTIQITDVRYSNVWY